MTSTFTQAARSHLPQFVHDVLPGVWHGCWSGGCSGGGGGRGGLVSQTHHPGPGLHVIIPRLCRVAGGPVGVAYHTLLPVVRTEPCGATTLVPTTSLIDLKYLRK